jgi:hypothetical protein
MPSRTCMKMGAIAYLARETATSATGEVIDFQASLSNRPGGSR